MPGKTLKLIAMLWLSLGAGWCQITRVTADQAPLIPHVGHNYIKLMNETVSPAVGAVDIQITVDSPPGRNLGVPFAIGYDSNSARHFNDGSNIPLDNGGYLGQGGWRYVVPSLQWTTAVFPIIGSGGSTIIQWCDTVDHYMFTDMEGTLHPLGLNQSPQSWQNCTGQGLYWNGPRMQNAGLLFTSTTSQLPPTSGPNPENNVPSVSVFDHDGTLYSFSNALGRMHGYGKNWFLTVNGNSVPGTDRSHLTGLPDFIETRNGNRIVFNDDDNGANGALHITDTLGRPAVTASSFGSPNGDTVSVSGFAQPYKLTWGTASFSWTYNGYFIAPPLSTYWFCSVPNGSQLHGHIGNDQGSETANRSGTLTGSGPVVTGLQLPNGLSYQFLYDNPNNDNPFGLLRQIIYPNGAYVRYVWTQNTASTAVTYSPYNVPPSPGTNTNIPTGWACEGIFDVPAVAKRFVSFDGVHEVQEQDFSYSTSWKLTNNSGNGNTPFETWTQKQTTVVTKDLATGVSFETVYTYTPVQDQLFGNDVEGAIGGFTGVYPSHPGEKIVQYYDTNGALLRTVTKNYSLEYLPPDELTTLDNGQSSYLHRAFNAGTNVVTDIFEYDYGTQLDSSAPGPHGPLLRHTHADYNHAFPLNLLMPAANPFTSAIIDRPSAVITYDGAGNRVGETDYGYDETPVASASATGHDDQNFGTGFSNGRGNATTKTAKCFIGTQACGAGDSVSKYAYDETGQQVSLTDPNGNIFKYSFADNFLDSKPPANAPSPSGNTNALLTQITGPQTNGVNHISNFAYAFSDSALTQSKDENGQVTTYVYDDPLRRLTETDLPAGGQSNVTYNDSGANPSVAATKKVTSSISVVSITVLDGMGHTIQTQTNSDPAGVDYTDTTYDGIGRAITATNPHRSASASTDGVTQTQYDALGRVIQVTRQDGSISSTSYYGNCSVMIDEAGKRRRQCNDGLGQLIEVDEPTPGVSEATPATNATATVSLSGTLQSKQLSNPATGRVTIFGTDSIVPGTSSYDFGTVTVSIGNASVSQPYGNGGASPTSANNLATALCSAINSTPSTSAQVRCTSTSGGVINLAAQATGSAGNGITLGVTAQTQFPQSNQSAFSGSSTSGSMSGGGAALYDSGTTTITISAFGDSTRWEGSGTTPLSITSSLASVINNDPTALVTATAAGSTIVLAAKAVGLGGNLPLSCSSSYDSTNFSAPSFSISCPSTLSGGHEAGSLSSPMLTLYSYDGLGNLLQVVQQGGTTDQTQWRTRTFTYDSLSRLLTAINPESGMISYLYDANGNLLQKTSPKPNQAASATQIVSYCYDTLNRVTGKAYSAQTCANGQLPAGTAVVSYTYDAGTNGIGHLTSLTDQAGSGIYNYDAMGRIAGESRTLAGKNKSMSYLYNLDGSIQSLTYPSGAVITYTPDAAGRMLSAVDNSNHINYVTGSGGPNPTSGATYGPDGSLLSFNQGWTPSFAGIANSFSYNPRLQPVNMSAASPGSTGTSATAGVTISGSLNRTGGDVAGNGSSLTSYVGSSGPGYAVYLDPNNHVVTVAPSNGASQWQDLTALSGGTPAKAGSALTSYAGSYPAHVYYQGANQHIYQLWANGSSWVNNDMTSASGANVVPASNTGLTSFLDSQGEHSFYIGTDNHVYQLWWNGTSEVNQDLTAISGMATALSGSMFSTCGNYAIFYQGSNGDIYQIWWNGSTWVGTDMNSGANPAASGTAMTCFTGAGGTHDLYVGQDNHVHDLFWNGSALIKQDLTNLSGCAAAMNGSALATYGNYAIVFQGGNGDIDQVWWNSSTSQWICNDLSVGSMVTPATRTALTAFTDSAGSHVIYLSSNARVFDRLWNGSSLIDQDLTANAATDAGTVSLNLGGFTATACFGPSTNPSCSGQSQNPNPSSVASALAAALNVSASPVSATVSGSTTINMTWKATGPFTTAVSTLSTTHDNPSLFPNPSFTGAATNFSGGSGANVSVFSLNYDFHAGNGDNGNVFGITNNKDTTRNQTFTYDALNRLTSAQNAGTDCTQKPLNPNQTKFWGQTYGYDGWGNLLQKSVTKCSGENLSVAALTNNQLVGYGYDAAGNMTSDPTDGLTTTSYDAENRIATVAKNGVTTSYTYDAHSNRVEKSNGSTSTLYWYMSPGIVAESDLSGNLQSEYVFFNGERVARKDFPSNAVSFYFSDHLKTTDIVTDGQGNIKNESDFYPWGGELQFTNNDSNHYKFTGKERDAETGLDYFGARYYSNGLGRWVTPDAPFADQHLLNPQSWNLYMYAGNRPTSLIDTDGREVKETVKYVFYDVHGKTAAEAHANALQASPFSENGEKFEGATQPSRSIVNITTSEDIQGFEGVAVTDTTTVKSADVKLDQTVTLPNWVEADKASPEDQTQWKTEVKDLKEHEDGHVKINSDGAHQLDKSLPGTKALGSGTTGTQAQAAASKKLSAAVTRKSKENAAQTHQRNVDYDKKTAHGLKQHEQQQ